MLRIFRPRVSPVRWMGVLSIAEGGQSNHAYDRSEENCTPK
jgi:hypothetical protein